jgi:hypothetical protein
MRTGILQNFFGGHHTESGAVNRRDLQAGRVSSPTHAGVKFRMALRGVARHLGVGAALILSVTLVTMLFNFLGTISCGALIGMMVGVTRRWRWQIILISLIFPAVMLGFMSFTKTDFTSRQSTVLPLICFGAFWLTYLLACALACLEKRDMPSSAESAVASPARTDTPKSVTEVHFRRQPDSNAVSPAVEPAGLCEPGLEELQGIWSQEYRAVNGQSLKKVIEVARDKLALSVWDHDGKVSLVCQGRVRLERLGPVKILSVVDLAAEPSLTSHERSDLPRTWVYKVAGRALTLASNLEESAADRESTIETYVKVRDGH